ncbi:unnamed protein product [marine sediment metagenome]|uniref:Uncharacterized protein n=1 Tax=marine sediment metagenome TaxID=412755 RepID=X1P228_9ZZZZ
MQEFTEEYKAIQKGLHKCWNERASKNDELTRLQASRKKVFGDIYLGLVSPSKKKIINSEIRQLEADISDADIGASELELRQTLMKRSGSHMQEKVEV